MRKRLTAAVALAIVVAMASVAAAQFRQRGFGGFSRRPLRYATQEDFDGGFQFCRVVFRQVADGDGGDWSVDFPRADENLSIRLSELTKTPVSFDAEGLPKHVLVNLSSPMLFRCPFIMMTEVGNTYFDEAEAKGLRDYLLKGGFLWADDFWGSHAWDIFMREMHKVLPPQQYPVIDVPLDHPMFHSLMALDHIPQIPSINFWGGPGGPTSERGFDSQTPHARAIVDDHQRVMVFITHNTDIGDSFEREGDSREYFVQFSVHGYALGVNVLLYAMTH